MDAVWRRYEISEEEFLAAAKRSRAMGSQGSGATMPIDVIRDRLEERAIALSEELEPSP
jgi:hypothetical protein